MGASGILYLTNNDTGYAAVYIPYIAWASKRIFVDVKLHEAGDESTVRIVDIDEQDACVMALKGIPLFKVESVGSPQSKGIVSVRHGYMQLVTIASHSSLLEWWRSLLHAM